MCRLFPSFGHRMHLKMFQMCKSNTLDFTHLASAAACKRNRVLQFKSESIFKSNFAHVSRCIFPPPRHEPQTTQQWGFPYWIDYVTDREPLASVPSHKHVTHQDCLVPSDLLCFTKKKKTFLFFCFQLAFLVIHMDWGFTHTNIHICSTILPSFWIHKKQQLTHSSICLQNLRIIGVIGPGWGYVLYSINCLHQPAYWLNHWQSSVPKMEPDKH